MAKVYRVPVYYQVSEYIPVKADSAEEAIEYIQNHQDEIPTHCGEAHYLDDSYEVESDPDSVRGYKEGSGLWAKEKWIESYYDATKEES